MCFSASASFGVGAVLLAGGVAALKRTKSISQIPFASIPILFSIQQFTEGFVWLSLSNESYSDWQQSSTLIFLIFAQAIWPSFVPFSIWLLEKNKMRKKILGAISIFGLAVGSYLLYCILNFSIDSKILGSHIFYDVDHQHTTIYYSGVFYFIPTVLPALISSHKRMLYFGLTILISFLFTKLFFPDYIISVWCYFAAALSILIYWIIGSANKAR
jgi:hypothetical protein